MLSAHAPYRDATHEYVEFWKHVSCVCNRVCTPWIPIVSGTDGNCQMFRMPDLSLPDGNVGIVCKKAPTIFCHMVECFCKVGIAPVNCHSDNIGNPSTSTFMPKRGNKGIRIDYVLVSAGVSCLPNSVVSVPELCHGVHFDDHIPLSAVLIIRTKSVDVCLSSVGLLSMIFGKLMTL